MLQVTFGNITINPQRPEAPVKTFSSTDVPHGTNSVIVKACKVARLNGHTFPAAPEFTPEEKAALVSTKKALITVLPLADEDGNPIIPSTELELSEASDKEVRAEFYVDPSADPLVPKTVEDPIRMKKTQKYVDLAAAKAFLEDKAKQERAEYLVSRDIDECLVVPPLSDDFKAQFTLTEIA